MIGQGIFKFLVIASIVILSSLSQDAQAQTIYPQSSGRIHDQASRVWAQEFSIEKTTRTLHFKTGAVSKKCIPSGDKGAWVSIVLVDRKGNTVGTYDNVAIANVENAENVFSRQGDLSQIPQDIMDDAVSFIPIMKGKAGC